MKPVLNPITDADVSTFDRFMRKWQARLNLLDWRIVRSSKRTTVNCAEISKRSLEDRLATYKVGMSFGAEPVNHHSLEKFACHETLHVFVHELIELAKDSNTADDVLMAAEHRVVNTLTHILVPPKEDTQ